MEERRQREEEKEEGAPHWMTTFSDMTTLLLTFFVLLFAFAQFDLIKFKRVMGSIREAFGVQRTQIGEFPTAETTPIQLFDYQKLDSVIEMFYRQTRMYRELKRELQKIPGVDVLVSERGIVVRAEERIFFDLGKADIKPEAYPFLDKMAELIKEYPEYRVAIEGHTDDLPINTPRFPSNWELSAIRATTVLRYFLSKGIPPERLKAVGYANTKPLVPNTSMENRAKNRRVEFVFSIETDEERFTRKFEEIMRELERRRIERLKSRTPEKISSKEAQPPG